MQMGLLQASGVLEATRTRPCGMSPCDYDRRGRETDKYTIQSKVKHLLGGLWRGRKKGRRGRERGRRRKRERGSLSERGQEERRLVSEAAGRKGVGVACLLKRQNNHNS